MMPDGKKGCLCHAVKHCTNCRHVRSGSHILMRPSVPRLTMMWVSVQYLIALTLACMRMHSAVLQAMLSIILSPSQSLQAASGTRWRRSARKELCITESQAGELAFGVVKCNCGLQLLPGSLHCKLVPGG